MTRLSCHRFRANEVRLWLSVIAYNLGNLWRRLGLPKRINTWSLTSLQHRLMKTGGRLVKHARCHWLLLAEGAPDTEPVRSDPAAAWGAIDARGKAPGPDRSPPVKEGGRRTGRGLRNR